MTPSRRPSGARPNPSRSPQPPRVSIPEGNIRESQSRFSTTHGSITSFGKIPDLTVISAGMIVDSNGQGGWQYPQALPSLALNPIKTSLAQPASRPKLSLSAIPSPGKPSMIIPTTIPSTRPPLLNAPSANLCSSRSSTPSLKLAIPGIAGMSSGFSMGHDYPESEDNDDALTSELKTPMALTDDRDSTLQARGRDYDGEGESSYGYGLMGNGLGDGTDGSQMSLMTHDIRQALSKSRYENSSSKSSRSRANSETGSASTVSRRSSVSRSEDLPALQALSIYDSKTDDRLCSSARGEQNQEGGEEDELPSPTFDPAGLEHIRRLGEGTGGAVELVMDSRSGRIMAKKVSVSDRRWVSN